MILLASADRYTALQRWLQELFSSQAIDTEIRIIDLSGEFDLDLAECIENNNCVVQNFDHARILGRLWKQLNPHANEWWRLLDIAHKQSIELPPLPGIEDLTRLIFLSEALDDAQADALLIAILPKPLHALKILAMAQQGPALIDHLLDPLLNWWDMTRQTLSAVEKLLRLCLPSSQQLRLNDAWKGRLHLLQNTISNRDNHHFTLILDCKNYEPRQLINRLSFTGLHRAIPHMLILEEVSTVANSAIVDECHNSPIIVKNSMSIPDLDQKERDVEENKAHKPIEEWNSEEQYVKIFFPGVSKSGLNIQQIDGTIHLIFNGYCRSIELPTEFAAMKCERAQMNEGWLNLWFNHD